MAELAKIISIAMFDVKNGSVDCSCFLQAMANAASPACILETRKTAPGLRLIDKWAVCIFRFLMLLCYKFSC